MRDESKSGEQRIAENDDWRLRVAALERRLRESQAATDLLRAAPLGIHECD